MPEFMQVECNKNMHNSAINDVKKSTHPKASTYFSTSSSAPRQPNVSKTQVLG